MKRSSMIAPIPKEVRKQLENEPRMKRCVVGGDCEGEIQWHHSQKFQGKRLQEAWAIVGICRKHHLGEARHKDKIDRDCFNRATDTELIRISKAENYIEKRELLNKRYAPH